MSSKRLMREFREVERDLKGLEIGGAVLDMMESAEIRRIVIAEQRKIIRYAAGHGIINQHDLNEGWIADAAIGLGSLLPFGVGNLVGAAGVVWYIKEMLKHPAGSFEFFMNLIMALLSSVAAADPTGLGAMGWLGDGAKLLVPFVRLGKAVEGVGAAIKGTEAAKAVISSLKIPGAEEIFHLIGSPKIAGGIETLLKGLNDYAPRFIKLVESPEAAAAIGKIPGAGAIWENFVKIVTEQATRAIQTVSKNIKGLVKLAQTAEGEAVEGIEGAATKQVNQAATGLYTKQAVKMGARGSLPFQQAATTAT